MPMHDNFLSMHFFKNGIGSMIVHTWKSFASLGIWSSQQCWALSWSCGDFLRSFASFGFWSSQQCWALFRSCGYLRSFGLISQQCLSSSLLREFSMIMGLQRCWAHLQAPISFGVFPFSSELPRNHAKISLDFLAKLCHFEDWFFFLSILCR